MFFGNNTILIAVVFGALLAFLGFGLRNRDGGVILIGIGLLIALGTLIYRAIEVFG